MFCKNCGIQIDASIAFCPECGTKVISEAAASAQSPVQEPTVSEAPVAPEQDYNFFEPDPEEKTPKKGKKLTKVLLFTGLPILLAALLVFTPIWDPFGLYSKFDSDAEELAYIEAKAIGGYTEVIANAYGMLVEPIGTTGVEGEIALELGDVITSMLSSSAYGMDLSWLKNIKISVDTDTNPDRMSGKLTLKLSDKDIITLDYIYDMQNQTVYFRCKELLDKYISVNISDMSNLYGISNDVYDSDVYEYDMYDSDEYEYDFYGMNTSRVEAATSQRTTLMNILLGNSDIKKALPTKQQLKNLLDKYVDIALKQITDDDITKTSGEITAKGVSEDCTIFELKITPDFLIRVVEAVLESAKNDKEIISIIEKFVKGMEDLAGEKTDVDVVSEYKDAIDELIEDIDRDTSDVADEYILITSYVNEDYEIIGRELSADFGQGKNKFLTYLSANDGEEYGLEVKVENALTFSGKGSKNEDAITGDFSLVVAGKEYLKVELDKFVASLKNLKGGIAFRVGRDATELLDDMEAMDDINLASFNPAIRFDFDSKASGGSVSMSLLTGNSVLAKIAISGKNTDSNVASIPDISDIVDAANVNPDDFNLNKIIENLEKAGVPAALLSFAQYSTF